MKFFSFRRFYIAFWARNKEFYRDKGALAWTFLFPLLMIFGFQFLFNMDASDQYKIGRFGGKAREAKFWSEVTYQDKREGLEQLRKHRLDLFFDENENVVYYQETSPKSQVALELFQKTELKSRPYEEQPVIGKKIRYVDWLFPGLLALNVLWMALWGVGWVVVRQRKLGVLKRLKVSPLTSFEYLLAQMVSRLMILFTSGFLVFWGAKLMVSFPFEGSHLAFWSIYLLGCLALSGVGLIVAARSTSEEFANGILNLITYPMMFLSEVWFSLEGSAEWLKEIMKIIPVWHMVDGMRKVMLEGAGFVELKSSLLYLFAIFLFTTLVGSLLFRWDKD